MYTYQIGKEFLLRNHITATVIDLNFGDHILLKYNLKDRFYTFKVTRDGKAYSGNTDYDIVSEKPKLLKNTTYIALYLSDKGELRIWGLYDTDDTDGTDVDEIAYNIISSGYKFYGVYKADFESDGTKKKLNF
jgi:hypothetical protein